MYLPLLWFAAREIGHKRQISRTTRMNVGLTGAVLMALGMLALWPAYRVSEDRHVLRDEIFPLNVLYNVHLECHGIPQGLQFRGRPRRISPTARRARPRHRGARYTSTSSAKPRVR